VNGRFVNYWTMTYRFAWLVLVLLVVIGLACVFIPKFREMNDLRQRRDDLQREGRATEAATRELRVKRERFSSDPRYVERVAKEAGMVKPGEIVFKFTNDTAEIRQ